MAAKKAPQPTENDALLPQSAPPPYEATEPLPSSSHQHAPPHPHPHPHAPSPAPNQRVYGPTPVASLPPAPPALWHASTSYNGHPTSRTGPHGHGHGRPYARADARARRRFCGALACALLVWFAVAAIFGAVLGEELVRRGGAGDDGRYAVTRWRGSGDEWEAPPCMQMARPLELKEGTDDEWVLAGDDTPDYDDPEAPASRCIDA
ncbi:hypothetical protein JCM9279_001942 [Rhodotorula babjevae]